MRIAITKFDETDFTPEEHRDLPEAERPVFRIAPLTGTQRHEVNDLRASSIREFRGESDANADLGLHTKAMRTAARYGLKGWRNIENEDGDPVAWPGSASKAIDLLPSEIVTAIGAAVVARSQLSEEQAGN